MSQKNISIIIKYAPYILVVLALLAPVFLAFIVMPLLAPDLNLSIKSFNFLLHWEDNWFLMGIVEAYGEERQRRFDFARFIVGCGLGAVAVLFFSGLILAFATWLGGGSTPTADSGSSESESGSANPPVFEPSLNTGGGGVAAGPNNSGAYNGDAS